MTSRLRPPATAFLLDDGQISAPWRGFLQSVADQLAVIAALPASPSYANDTAAAAGGVQVGTLYRNGSVVQIRVT